MGNTIWAIDMVARETMLFAAVGFLIGGVDDVVIDLIYFVRRARQRFAPDPSLAGLPVPAVPGRLAVFVAAWDEANVIGAMLTTALARFDHPDYHIYVGCYPNDLATIEEVARVAAADHRVRMVVGARAGPTTKADNLNQLWSALQRHDREDGHRTKAVVLHDAEDVVHPAELTVYDALTEEYAVVQIPVLPLINPRARFVSGHYADEFAEGHVKQLVVRSSTLGAGLPLAGVGCAIRVEALETIAADHGCPFDASSVTEDYELGLRIAATGRTTVFARIRDETRGELVAVRAYFPSTVSAAVSQKARWMRGIALSGWDRIGWSRTLDLREHWMRMRDRRAPIAILILAAGYAALFYWAISIVAHAIDGTSAPGSAPWVVTLLWINLALLGWRVAIRVAVTSSAYGWREGMYAVPRIVVSNYIAILAVRLAFQRYLETTSGQTPHWDKTDHVFPTFASESGAA